MSDISVKTLTNSVNIALTDEYLVEIDKGELDVYSTEVTFRNAEGLAVREDGQVRVAVFAEGSERAVKRFLITVREVPL